MIKLSFNASELNVLMRMCTTLGFLITSSMSYVIGLYVMEIAWDVPQYILAGTILLASVSVAMMLRNLLREKEKESLEGKSSGDGLVDNKEMIAKRHVALPEKHRAGVSVILSQPQAQAVYSAMCALNDVGGRVDARMSEDGAVETRVREGLSGYIHITAENRDAMGSSELVEQYDDQNAFAVAYGLVGA